jgi:hypothetical protein
VATLLVASTNFSGAMAFSGASGQGNISEQIRAASLAIYNVTLRVSPKSQSVGVGGSVNYKIKSENEGSYTFNATGYVLMVKPPHSSIYSRYNYPINTSVMILANSTMTTIYNVKVGPSSQQGGYGLVFYWTGTVNGVSMRTHFCNFSLVVD